MRLFRSAHRSGFLGTFFLVVSLSLTAVAAKEFVLPKAFPALTYPARDEHPLEKVTIAADPYDMPDKASIFILPYKEKGYLPVFFVITNDGDAPIALADMRVQMATVNNSKIRAATDEDLYRRFSRVKRRGDEAQRNPLPIPLPRKGADVGLPKGGVEEVNAAQFHAKAVEPHTTQAGFLFFDVEDIANPLAGAHIYITGVRDSQGQELMYFEIAMEKYLTYRP